MSGIELIFSIVAHMVLCFGLVMKNSVDNIPIAEQGLYNIKAFSVSHAAPSEDTGSVQEFGRGYSQDT